MTDNKEQRRIALEAERRLLERNIAANTDAILSDEYTSLGFVGQVNAWTRNRARLSEIDRELSLLEEKKAQHE